MIYYFIKPSGGGKSTAATAFMVQFLENSNTATRDTKKLFGFLEETPSDRLKRCHRLIDRWNAKGYNFKKPEHVVWSNMAIWTRQFGKDIINYDLPGYRIGLYDKNFETWTPAPGGIVIWDEVQRESDGRDSMEMHPRVREFTRLHRKWGLDVLCFSQRDKVDKNIRENCKIILIQNIEHKKDKYGFITSTTLTFWFFDDYLHYEAYKASLKSKYYTVTKFTFDGNVQEHFDTNEGEEYFVECADRRGGISLKKAEFKKNTKSDIKRYVDNNSYMPPKGYKKGASK